MIDAPRPLDGLVPGFRAPARLFSEEPDQGQERHDKTGGGGEQVNIAMPKAAIPNVVLPCRDLTASYNRPYSASLGSQGAVREDSGTIPRLRHVGVDEACPPRCRVRSPLAVRKTSQSRTSPSSCTRPLAAGWRKIKTAAAATPKALLCRLKGCSRWQVTRGGCVRWFQRPLRRL